MFIMIAYCLENISDFIVNAISRRLYAYFSLHMAYFNYVLVDYH